MKEIQQGMTATQVSETIMGNFSEVSAEADRAKTMAAAEEERAKGVEQGLSAAVAQNVEEIIALKGNSATKEELNAEAERAQSAEELINQQAELNFRNFSELGVEESAKIDGYEIALTKKTNTAQKTKVKVPVYDMQNPSATPVGLVDEIFVEDMKAEAKKMVDAEAERAQGAEGEIRGSVESLGEDLNAASEDISKLEVALEAEKSRAQEAEQSLSTEITEAENRVDERVTEVRDSLEAEVQARSEAVADLEANMGISEYAAFDPAVDYAVGDVVKYEGRLYRFTADHAQGEWIGTDVEKWSERKEITGVRSSSFIPNYTLVKGKYISRYNLESESKGFAHTTPFDLLPNQTIYIEAKGYLDRVAMIAQYKDGIYKTLAASLEDNLIHIYSYTNITDETISIVCSFSLSYPYNIIISNMLDKSVADKVKEKYEIFNAKIKNLEEEINSQDILLKKVESDVGLLDIQINGTEQRVEIPIRIAELDKYITSFGSVLESNNTMYSLPIPVRKGITYIFRGRGFSTNMGMISTTDKDGTDYKVVARSIDSELQDYIYKAEENGYIAVSSFTTQEYSLVAYNENGVISELKEQISTIVTNIESEIIGIQGSSFIPNYTLVDGKYITAYGYEGSSANFARTSAFGLLPNQTIFIKGKGYQDRVSMIAKPQDDGTYVALVTSLEDDLIHIYSYTNTSDSEINVVCSFSINFPYAILISNLVDKKNVDKIQDDVYELNEKVEQIKEDASIHQKLVMLSNSLAFAGIPKVGIIGDSLSSGVTYTEDGVSTTNYDKAWWNVLKRDSEAEYLYFAEGGLSTRTWFESSNGWSKANIEGNECCAYVIALGVNDHYRLGVDYLGTINDIKDDASLNSDTFFGNYGKIIQFLTNKVPKAKFFLLTVPRTTGDYSSFNDAIRNIAEKFTNCYLVDLEKDYLNFFQDGFIKAQEFGGAHYSASGYAAIGKVIEFAISKVIVDNALDFRYIQFAVDL